MKKIITLLSILLCSCSNIYIEDSKYINSHDAEELTTAALLKKIDTTQTYYVVFKEDRIYTINTNTKLVEHRIVDNSGIVTILILIIVTLIALVIILKMLLEN